MSAAGLRGTALLKQALVDDQAALLDAAIDALQAGGRETPAEDVNALTWLSNLAAALRTRYTRRGDQRDLDQAIEVLNQVVHQTSAADPSQPSRLGNLGRAVHDRYLARGGDHDLDDAITTLRSAARSATGAVLVSHATNLGGALSDRFERRHAVADLDEAIDWLRTALTQDATSPSTWTNLSSALHLRFEVS